MLTYFAAGTELPAGFHFDAMAAGDDPGAATIFRVRFSADADSRVAWNATAGYSMFNARLQISTVSGGSQDEDGREPTEAILEQGS